MNRQWISVDGQMCKSILMFHVTTDYDFDAAGLEDEVRRRLPGVALTIGRRCQTEGHIHRLAVTFSSGAKIHTEETERTVDTDLVIGVLQDIEDEVRESLQRDRVLEAVLPGGKIPPA